MNEYIEKDEETQVEANIPFSVVSLTATSLNLPCRIPHSPDVADQV